VMSLMSLKTMPEPGLQAVERGQQGCEMFGRHPHGATSRGVRDRNSEYAYSLPPWLLHTHAAGCSAAAMAW
jgi:hypothetical protein